MGVIAKTALGRLEESERGDVDIFRGIAYAKAPRGPLRWRTPLPAEAWTGVHRDTKSPSLLTLFAIS